VKSATLCLHNMYNIVCASYYGFTQNHDPDIVFCRCLR